MSIQSRIVRGIGFGAMAVATLGFIIPVEQTQTSGGYYPNNKHRPISILPSPDKPHDDEEVLFLTGMI